MDGTTRDKHQAIHLGIIYYNRNGRDRIRETRNSKEEMKAETNLREDIFFCAWKNAFGEQLEELHQNYLDSPQGIEDPLDFLDFCVVIWQQGGDIINYNATNSRQN